MSERSLEAWLRSRVPPIPQPFLPRLLGGEGARCGVAELTTLGLDAREEALRRPGRNREAAFHLLAGDAFLTYACEAAAGEVDVGACLTRFLEQMGDRFR